MVASKQVFPGKEQMDAMISAPDSNEYINTITHFVGALLSVLATVLLIALAARDQKWAHLVGFAVYGITMLLSFAASCVLHLYLLFGRYKRLLGILDHSAIYLLIAGTYTPFCLTIFEPPTGWWVLAVVWGLALFWIVMKAFFFVRMSSLISNLSYISMGWIAILLAVPIVEQLGSGAALLMTIGGVVYTLGAISFQYGKPNPFPPYFGNHEIWHLAVMLGNGLFFCVMLFFVLPHA